MKQQIIIAGLLILFLAGCSKKQPSAALPKPPKLIVFIAIDQFPYEYLTKFKPYFGKDGFLKLMEGGASFTNCLYAQATTQTSVGHAVMMSGMDPSEHGITANYWYDRNLRKKVYSCEDTTVAVIGMKSKSVQDGRSPRSFVGTNLADQLRMYTGFKSKVFAVSNKDRSAILMAGKHPNAAYWFSESIGGAISSSYYLDAFPKWVVDFNSGRSYDRWLGESWNPILESSKYPVLPQDVLTMVSPPTAIYGKTFPHKLSDKEKPDPGYYKSLMASPFGSEEILDFTELLLNHEELGKDGTPDILCVSFSSNDKVGHIYGPSSPEVMDMVVRTDRDLARLMTVVNTAVGEKEVLYVLTSDHGVTAMPEEFKAAGIEAGRVKPEAMELWIDSVMTAKYGPVRGNGRYAARITYPDFYFNEGVLAEKKIDKVEAEDYISASLAKHGVGVARAYAGYRLMRGEVAPDKISQAIHRSFFAERSGDIVILLKPYYMWDVDGFGTEHSLPYTYDAHVPLIMKGSRWIRSGTYTKACSPADIAPTLATILGINLGGGLGHDPIHEVLRFSK